MRLRLYIFSFILACQTTWAQNVGMKSEIGASCVNNALKFDFGCPKVKLPLTCPCRNPNFLTTVLDCVDRNSHDVEDKLKAFRFIRSQCHKWGATTYNYTQMDALLAANKDKLIDEQDYQGGVTDLPIRISDDSFQRQFITARNTRFHYWVGDCFAWGIIGYWSLVMVVATFFNVCRILRLDMFNFLGKKYVIAFRKYLTLPALVGCKHQSPWSWLGWKLYFPTRGQTLIIIGFLGINIASIVSFLGTNGDTPLLFTTHSDRVLHYLVNRTGIIAVGHIPLIVLFACRNNPLIFLTGWTYPTFMTFHRWCARCMGIHAVIHGVAMYWTSFNEKVVLFKWRNVYNWTGGNIAAYMVIIMLILSFRQFRARFYEFFKITHQAMFLIFIVCLVIHCSDYGWLGWLYASFAFYGVEYFLRFARQIAAGGIQDAEFVATDAGMYRVRMCPNNRKWNIHPGYYIYLRVLDKNLFWQSHPFSVYPSYTENNERSILLICKALNGATKKLYDEVCSSPYGTLNKKVMIEGPYGHGNYAAEYDSVLLFAGGCGFSAMYTYANSIMKRLKPGQYLCLIWVVKDLSSVRALQSEVDYLHKQHGKTCDFRVYVTRGCINELNQVKELNLAHAENSGGVVEEVKPEVDAQVNSETTGEPETNTGSDTSNGNDNDNDNNNVPPLPGIRVQTPSTSTLNSSKSGTGTESDDEPEKEKSHRSRVTESQPCSHNDCTASSLRNNDLETRDVNVSTSEDDLAGCTIGDSQDNDCEASLVMEYHETGLLSNIKFHRPNIKNEVADFIRLSIGSKSVCSCGPPMFVDSIREAVVDSISSSQERVDYFEDAFSW